MEPLKCIEAVYKKVQRKLDDPLTMDGSAFPPYLVPDKREGTSLVTCKAQESADQLECAFVFIDEERGFVGYFKEFTGPGWASRLLQDLHFVALLRQEQILSVLVPREDEHAIARRRSWNHHLFALIPDEETDEEFQAIWDDIQQGRLLQEAGMSLLKCSADSYTELSKETPENTHVNREIRRFLAPLLLNVRQWQNGGSKGLKNWRHDLLDKLDGQVRTHPTEVSERNQVARAVPGVDGDGNTASLENWATKKLRESLDAKLGTFGPPAPATLVRLEDLAVRRFTLTGDELPFGRFTLIHGPNGSGKTTLLESIEIAVSGRIRRLDVSASMHNTARKELYKVLRPVGDTVAGRLVTHAESTSSRSPTDESIHYVVDTPKEGPEIPLDSFVLRQEQLSVSGIMDLQSSAVKMS